MENIKILVIDDEIKVLDVIKTILLNYNLTLAASSYEGAELIRQNKYDVYIVDYQMPNLNGIEIFELIKTENKDMNYIGIFCTAHGTIHIFKEELTDGLFDFFIEKPFEVGEFKQVFDKAIIKLRKIKNKG